jgi:hypothetical protein
LRDDRFGSIATEIRDLEPLSDEHLRTILEIFDPKRLTTQVGTTLLEILERQDERLNDLAYSEKGS